MHYRLTLLATMFSCFGAVKADTHPDNFLISLDNDLRRVFRGKSKTTDAKTKNQKKVQEVTTKSLLDDYEMAEEKIFRTLESVEKKAFGVAETLIHDEVDILFGKDHGHAIHDDRTIKSVQPATSRRSMRVPFKNHKETMDVKNTHELKKVELPHTSFLDFMETYARDLTQTGM